MTHPAVDTSLRWVESLWSCLPCSFNDRRSLKIDVSVQSWAQGSPRACVDAAAALSPPAAVGTPGMSLQHPQDPWQGDHIEEKRQCSLWAQKVVKGLGGNVLLFGLPAERG